MRVETHPAAVEFGREALAEEAGMSAEGVRRVVKVFDGFLEKGLHPGAQLVVLKAGKVVLDRAAGTAHLGRRQPVLPSTPFLTFSVAKAFTGACVHQLIEQGKVELDAPIAVYWPEFGCKGKEGATIRHAFLHQAAVPLRGLYRQIPLWPRWNAITRSVAALPAEFPPGSRTAYHMVNYGFILGEVIRRVSGLKPDEYLRRHFLEPLGLKDTFLGLPTSERFRAAGLYSGHRQSWGVVQVFNNPSIRRAVIPAATLHSSARDLAVFYQMLLNGGSYAGRQYLQPETVEAATRLGYEGFDGTIRLLTRWAYGFHLGGEIPGAGAAPIMGKGSTIRTFGHFGQSSCFAWADPDHQIAAAFTCNRLLYTLRSRARWKELNDAIWDAAAG